MPLKHIISAIDSGDDSKPKYLLIAEELARAIASGQMPPGERLPPQRHLAVQLKVTTGTISRAYATLERRGLATARVGDGTYVRSVDTTPGEVPGTPLAPIDLAHNIAIPTDEHACLVNAMTGLAADPEAMRQVLMYQPEIGSHHHREAGAKWLRRMGTSGQSSRVMVTNGAQHALACVLRTLARPGDVVLTEPLTYPGLQALARTMRLQLIGVETDGEGLLPDALERAAKNYAARLLFCTPTLHNPTTSTMSMRRREEVAQVAQRNSLLLIEDCVPAAVQESGLPALSTLMPKQSFLLSSFSKVMAPGLRIGYLESAPEWQSKFAATMRADCWMVAPLMPEIATRWIESGAIDHLIDQQRRKIAERWAVAQPYLAAIEHRQVPHHALVWLPLPDPWRAGQFAAALRKLNVITRTAGHFAVGRAPAPHALRISLNSPKTITELVDGLELLTSLLANPPSAPMDA